MFVAVAVCMKAVAIGMIDSRMGRGRAPRKRNVCLRDDDKISRSMCVLTFSRVGLVQMTTPSERLEGMPPQLTSPQLR